MDLTKCISELLAVHDCVIIPGFGGFIGNYSPARIDPVHHVFSPPFKKLLFNINLNQNDGLLANHFSCAEGIPYPDASKRISEMIESCRHDLKSGKPFIIPEVGKIFMGKEGNIQFEQDKTVNLLPDAYGLSTFISPPVIRISPQSTLGTTIPIITKQRERHIGLPRSLKWAAILAIPFGLTTMIGITQYDKFKFNQVNKAGILNSVFSRFSSTSLVDKKEVPQTYTTTQFQMESPLSVLNSPPVEYFSDNDEGNFNDASSVELKPVQAPIPNINTESKYAIIIGAFKIRENAVNLVTDLGRKNIPSAIFDRSKSGLYRVAIGTAGSRQEAEQLLEHTKSGEFNEAWLLEK